MLSGRCDCAPGSATLSRRGVLCAGATTGRIAPRTVERPLQPTREKIGVANGFGCYPERVSPAKATGDHVPDDFDHEIATNDVVRNKGLVVLTSCSHRGVLNAVRQAQEASGVSRVLPSSAVSIWSRR